MKLKSKLVPAIAIVLVLVAQTSNTIDLTPIVGILTSLLPLILTIVVIMMVFKLIGGLFESLGSVFRFVKIKMLFIFTRLKISRFAKLSLPVLIAVVAQTTTEAVDVASAANLATSLIYAILPVIFVFMVVMIVFKMIGKLGDVIKF